MCGWGGGWEVGWWSEVVAIEGKGAEVRRGRREGERTVCQGTILTL